MTGPAVSAEPQSLSRHLTSLTKAGTRQCLRRISFLYLSIHPPSVHHPSVISLYRTGSYRHREADWQVASKLPRVPFLWRTMADSARLGPLRLVLQERLGPSTARKPQRRQRGAGHLWGARTTGSRAQGCPGPESQPGTNFLLASRSTPATRAALPDTVGQSPPCPVLCAHPAATPQLASPAR